MPVRRHSPAVLIYVAVAVAQLVAVLIISGGGLSIPGVILAAILFGFLYLGQPLAWWLLVLLNTVGLAALVVTTVSDLVSSDHVLWGNVLVLFVTSAAMEVVLLSADMRRHVASRGMRLAARPAAPSSRPAVAPSRPAASPRSRAKPSSAAATPADSGAAPRARPSARREPPRARAASRSSGQRRRP